MPSNTMHTNTRMFIAAYYRVINFLLPEQLCKFSCIMGVPNEVSSSFPGALVQALALPALKAPRDVSSIGFTAISALAPERKLHVRLRRVIKKRKTGDYGNENREDEDYDAFLNRVPKIAIS